MKCEKCKSEWSSSRSIQVCPFCGESLVQPESKKPEEILCYIVDEYGVEVLQKKKLLLSYFSDFAPHLNKEYKLIKNCCSTDFISLLLSSGSSNDSREIAIKKATRLLMDECFMSEEYANNVITWITVALKWEIPAKINIPKPEPKRVQILPSESKDEESKPHSTTGNNRTKQFSHLKFGFCKEKYEYESEDIEYQLGMRSVVQEDYNDALERFEKAFNNGNTLAGTKLAQMYYFGKGCDVNYDKACSIFKYNADTESCPLATAWIADMYRMGKGFQKDEIKAKNIYVSNKDNLLLMCEYGDSDAQYFLGYDLMYGTFGEKNSNVGFKWLEKSSNQGNVASKVEIAKCFLYGDPVEKQEHIGFEILSSISNTSNKKCHYEIGRCFYFGIGTDKDYSLAYKHLLFAAERGHVSAQSFVGDMLYLGEGVSCDYGKAREWFEKAAKHDNSNSLLRLAFIYDYGRGVKVDKDKALTYYKKAADLDNSTACSCLADIYSEKGNIEKKYYYRKKAADLGRRDDQFNMIFLLLDEKLSQYYNEKECVKYLIQSAEQGYSKAQNVLARAYICGQYGLQEDDELFVHWMTKAAEQGDIEAQRILGEAYYKADSPPVLAINYSLACQWLEKAAENGDVKACIDLAELYLSGEGLSKDIEKVEKYLLLALEKGEIDAYCKLALIYVNEKRWYDKGFLLLEKAHEKGSIEGTRLLGLCYKAGIGCKKSRSKAKALFKEAADQGDEEAKAELKKYRF